MEIEWNVYIIFFHSLWIYPPLWMRLRALKVWRCWKWQPISSRLCWFSARSASEDVSCLHFTDCTALIGKLSWAFAPFFNVSSRLSSSEWKMNERAFARLLWCRVANRVADCGAKTIRSVGVSWDFGFSTTIIILAKKTRELSSFFSLCCSNSYIILHH